MIKPALTNQFRNCLASLLKLHDLQLAGNHDSSDAETFRAALDLEWPLLSMREQTAWIDVSDLLLIQKAIPE